MFLYIRSITKNEDIAEEITQETFVKALRSIESFDGSKDIRAWLFTIAKNTYFTYCRRQKIYVDREIDDTIVSQNSSVEDSIINEENAFSIHRFLHSMNEPYKEVFTLRVFGELSYKTIGALFSKSSGWARITYYRAKKQILEYMEAMENEKK